MLQLQYILGIAAMLLLIYIFFQWKYRKFIKLSKILKHDLLSLPVIGITYLFMGGDEAIMNGLKILGNEALKKNGMIADWFGHRFFVVIADPMTAHTISKECLEKDDIIKTTFKHVLGQNSHFVAPVPLWRPRRKHLALGFASKCLNQYLSVFVERSGALVNNLRPNVGQQVLMFSHFYKYTYESTLQTTFGISNSEKFTNHPLLGKMLKETDELLSERIVKPWLHSDLVYRFTSSYKTLMKYKQEFFMIQDEAIKSQRESMKKEKTQKSVAMKSLLRLLMEQTTENGEAQYSDMDLKAEMSLLAFASTKTTTAALGFCSLVLARYPNVQEKVYEELKRVFNDQMRPVEVADLLKLNYLTAVIKETLRVFTVAPVVARKVEKDIELSPGVVLPRGCGVVLHIWALNRNPKYWGSDAEEFKPERFLDSSYKHPAQFAAFSFGPRNCIGGRYSIMSMKTVLATILRHYQFLPATGADGKPYLEPQMKYGIATTDINNFPVRLELRKEKTL